MATQPYKIDGVRVPGVTTVISNCKLGGIEPLLYWANQEGLSGRNHRDTRDQAANAGTCAHEMIEADIKGTEFDDSKYFHSIIDIAVPCFDAYKKWREQTNLKLISSEISLVSKKYKYGGTMDALAMGDSLVLGDWKTSNGVYPDYIIQLAAYQQLWNENNPDSPITGGAFLLRVSRPSEIDDPVNFAYHYWNNLDMAFQAFLKMRELYDLHKRLKGLC